MPGAEIAFEEVDGRACGAPADVAAGGARRGRAPAARQVGEAAEAGGRQRGGAGGRCCAAPQLAAAMGAGGRPTRRRRTAALAEAEPGGPGHARLGAPRGASHGSLGTVSGSSERLRLAMRSYWVVMGYVGVSGAGLGPCGGLGEPRKITFQKWRKSETVWCHNPGPVLSWSMFLGCKHIY